MENLSDVLEREREADDILLLRDALPVDPVTGVRADALFLRGSDVQSLTIIEEAIREQEYINVCDAHELGHHRTVLKVCIGGRTYNIFDMDRTLQDMFERMAEREAASICLSPERVIDAYVEGCRMPHEFADALQITEQKFDEWMQHQKMRYGTRRFTSRGWCLTFDPFQVAEAE